MRSDLAEWEPDVRVLADRGEKCSAKLAVVALDEVKRLTSQLNSPEVDDFVRGVVFEAAHQREKWGFDHDNAKAPSDWFWTVGYVLGKAQFLNDGEKRRHHLITAAAVMLNWHLYVSGKVPGHKKGGG